LLDGFTSFCVLRLCRIIFNERIDSAQTYLSTTVLRAPTPKSSYKCVGNKKMSALTHISSQNWRHLDTSSTFPAKVVDVSTKSISPVCNIIINAPNCFKAKHSFVFVLASMQPFDIQGLGLSLSKRAPNPL
jgi:hypothetical protein